MTDIPDIHSAVQTRLQEFPLTTPLREVVSGSVMPLPSTATIRQAVAQMSQANISCLVVADAGEVVGIFTDRDIRSRVVAAGADLEAPLATVMSKRPFTITTNQYAFQALLLMSQHNIHHLPVLDDGQLVGVVSTTDLMQLQATTPVYLAGDIWRQPDVAGLVAVSRRLPQLVARLVTADAKAEDVGRVVSIVSDALTQRLLQLAEATLGPPPVPYAWLAFGSQARQEQTAHSDQDNGLLLDDAFQPGHDSYFAALARFVCDGLNACGYIYCPGQVMATNPLWRQPLHVWRNYFANWLHEPSPEALLHTCIFFDLRHLFGAADLSATLLADVVGQSQQNGRFLGNMAKNALDFQPPVGFWRRLHLDEGKIDLKRRGLFPIIELVRVYALAYGVTAVNTHDRLNALLPTPAFVKQDVHNLNDALEFIAYVRLRHQGQQLAARQLADNLLDPAELSKFDLEHLKAAFAIVQQAQNILSQRYLTALY